MTELGRFLYMDCQLYNWALNRHFDLYYDVSYLLCLEERDL